MSEWHELKRSGDFSRHNRNGDFSRHNLTVAEAHRYGLRFD
jgi:hypothetical protein